MPDAPRRPSSGVPGRRPRRVAGTTSSPRTEPSSETPTETPTETPVETSVETSVETPTEVPAEMLAETPAQTPAETPTDAPAETRAETSRSATTTLAPPPEYDASLGGGSARSVSRRVLVVLSSVVVLLLALGGVEIWYLTSGDDHPNTVPSAERPVVLSDLTVRSVVDQAAQAAQSILAVDWKTFDAQVSKAESLMTPTFAAKFKQTKADIRKPFIKQRASVSVNISNQGVVTASPSEIRVLLFLTEQTSKPTGSSSVQFRVVVTMTKVGDRWMVASLDAI